MVEKAIILQRSLTSEPPNIDATKLTAFLTELVKDSNGVNGTEKCNKNHKRKTTNGFPNNHWFDAECKTQKRNVKDAKIISILAQGTKTNGKHTFVRRKFIRE